jgi:hypothetical protein
VRHGLAQQRQDLSIAELAPELRSTAAWPGCIGGAISLDDYLSQLRAAG